MYYAGECSGVLAGALGGYPDAGAVEHGYVPAPVGLRPGDLGGRLAVGRADPDAREVGRPEGALLVLAPSPSLHGLVEEAAEDESAGAYVEYDDVAL